MQRSLSRPISACVYGAPPSDLAPTPDGARQVSPLMPGADALEALAAGSLDAAVIAAPPGTLERRYALALALRALRPGGAMTALAPKERGGARLRKELEGFGCRVDETARQHQRICLTTRPDAAIGLDDAIAAGGPRRLNVDGPWTQPGVFSWDRDDPGSQSLIAALPALSGRGADLGCGVGVLAKAVLASPAVTRLDLADIDRRAIDAARRNLDDPRAFPHWADVRDGLDLSDLDFVVMNPPFHADGAQDTGLGQAFVRRAHQMLRTGGVLWMVANRHLPYEAALAAFRQVTPRGDGRGFKIYEARK
jgi:16S rRNA (guanine1207-N2)-methyltransferase